MNLAMNRSYLLTLLLWLGGSYFAAVNGQTTKTNMVPDYIVAFWYEKSDPEHKFYNQPYDLRKHQYNEKVVKSWLDEVRAHHPGARAYLRSFSLADLPGTTEDEKLSRAVQREMMEVRSLLRSYSTRREHLSTVAPSVGNAGHGVVPRVRSSIPPKRVDLSPPSLSPSIPPPILFRPR
jgi:hypothetical protein